MSASQASSTAVGSRMDPVRALQQALYRSAKADPGRGPVRRVWIPKPGKPEKRPLGIGTVTVRRGKSHVVSGYTVWRLHW